MKEFSKMLMQNSSLQKLRLFFCVYWVKMIGWWICCCCCSRKTFIVLLECCVHCCTVILEPINSIYFCRRKKSDYVSRIDFLPIVWEQIRLLLLEQKRLVNVFAIIKLSHNSGFFSSLFFSFSSLDFYSFRSFFFPLKFGSLSDKR